MEREVYDLVIVGAGMIGSAAARYASLHAGVKVCVIGPDEPQTRTADDGRDVYGAYYDEARITNSVQYDRVWASLAARSIAQYRSLEKLSGIHFYEETGALRICTENGQVLKTTLEAAAAAGEQTELWNHDQSLSTFPYIHLNQGEQIQAELTVALNNNCDIIRDIVAKIEYPTNRKDPIKLVTDLGNTFYARKVLLCPGAFVELRRLLPGGSIPTMKLITQSVIFAQLSESDLTKMRGMPSLVKKVEVGANWENDCYVLPPVLYPDGKYYIKLGHGAQFDNELAPEQVKAWYCQQVPPHIAHRLEHTLNHLFPDFKPVRIHSDTCLTTRTPNSRLFLDLLSPHVGVAIGGNGYAAKSCDHIGMLAADLVLAGKWTSDLPRDWFKFQNMTSKL